MLLYADLIVDVRKSLLEIADALSHGPADFGQSLRSEDDKGQDEDNHQLRDMAGKHTKLLLNVATLLRLRGSASTFLLPLLSVRL